LGTLVDFIAAIAQPPSIPSLSIDRILQPLPRLELGLPEGGELDGFAGTGIPTFTRCTVDDCEAAEPGKTNIVTICQSIGNDIECGIDGTGCVGFRDTSGFGDSGDKFGFIHHGPTVWSSWSSMGIAANTGSVEQSRQNRVTNEDT
jgi:hypothetical protein